MGPPVPLSKAEMEVARIVWDLKRATVREVHEVLSRSREVEYKTVQTFLNRLEQKGYVRAKREGRSMVFTPRIRQRSVIKETVADFVQRLFDGDPLPLMEHLIQEQSLSEDDLARLRQLIESKEQDQAGGLK